MLHVWALKCLRFMARKSIANIVTSLIQWSCALFIVFISNVKMPSIVLVIVTNSDCYISTRLTLTLSEILLCWECDTMMLAQIEIQIFLHFFNMPSGWPQLFNKNWILNEPIHLVDQELFGFILWKLIVIKPKPDI